MCAKPAITSLSLASRKESITTPASAPARRPGENKRNEDAALYHYWIFAAQSVWDAMNNLVVRRSGRVLWAWVARPASTVALASISNDKHFLRRAAYVRA